MTNLSRKLQHLINGAFVWLVGLLPFVFCWTSDELFEFNKMLFVYVFAIFIGVLFAVRMIVERRFLFRHTVFDWPLGFFVLSQIISTILSIHPRTSLLGYYTRLNGGLLSTLAYVILYYSFVGNVDLRTRSRLLKSIFLSGILVSLYAAGEHFGHSMSCLIIKGHFNVSCWIQDVQTRVFATFGQPNWLAAYNVTLIGFGTPLILQFFRKHEPSSIWSSRLLHYLIPLSVYLNYMCLIFTKSRSGILACFAGLALVNLLLLISWFRHNRHTLAAHLKRLVLIDGGFIIISLIWGTQYTPSLRQLARPIFAQAPAAAEMGLPSHLRDINVHITDSADIRKIVYQGAIDIWRHHPLFGTGVETFAYSYYTYRPTDHNWTSEWDFLYNKAHNELLNLAANSGTVGLLSYLSIFIVLAIITLRFILTRPTPSSYTTRATYLIGISGSLLALSITNFFGFSTVCVQVLLFLLLAWAAIIYQQINIAPLNNRLTGTARRLAVAVIVFIGLIGLDQVWRTWFADYNYARCKSQLTLSRGDALQFCVQAIDLRPREALYQVELADYYAQYAVALARQNPDQAELIEQLANESLRLSDNALRLNNRNLNFYKTRFRTLLNLAQIDPNAYQAARRTLDVALLLSPTDPKLTYYYSTLLSMLDDEQGAQEYLDRTLQLRPLYYEARLKAAQKAEADGDYDTAYQHYWYFNQFINQDDQSAIEGLARTATLSGQIDYTEGSL